MHERNKSVIKLIYPMGTQTKIGKPNGKLDQKD